MLSFREGKNVFAKAGPFLDDPLRQLPTPLPKSSPEPLTDCPLGGQRVCIVRPIIRSSFYAATAIGEMAVTMDFERPGQSDGRTCGGHLEDQTLPVGCKDDILRELSEILEERLFPGKKAIRRKSMIVERLEPANRKSEAYDTSNHRKHASPAPTSPVAVLKELFELLEDYGPAWYTEENHDRAVAALMLHT